ncbi:hypothetical protein GGR54DRAFT_652366 [Hypoxylon sp. NC1633]|nr:hypothetical protein GGR54DRAFT_652366 [Hypoxylon sp. NC1633]
MPQAQVMRRTSRVDLALPTDPCSVAAGPGSPFFALHIPESGAPSPQARPSKGDLDVPGLSCSTRWLPSRHQISSVARTERLSTTTFSMDRFHQFESMRSVIQNALPNITVESVNPLPSCRLLRFFGINLIDGRILLLSLPPHPTLRLLRSERAMNLSETVVTKWLLEVILQIPIKVEDATHESTGTYRHTESEPRTDGHTVTLEGRCDPRDVLRLLPMLVVHSPSSADLGSPFNIFEPTRGIAISGLPTPLTTPEKKITDFQQGQLVRQLSSFTSPNGLFGPATAVIGSQHPSDPSHGMQLANLGFRGARAWKQAFHSLLEGVLRDAEDMAVTISYEPIRGYFNRLGHFMDGVTTARLVILDASDETNVLVSRSAKTAEKENETHSPPTPKKDIKQNETDVKPGNVTKEQDRGENEGGELSNPQQPSISVAGLRDWSSCVFGDPLFAEAFSQSPSPDFLRGFRKAQGSEASTGEYDDSLVDDCENVPVRLLLYECYHATVSVVKQFYRPGPESSEREIAARRRLAAALRRLEEVNEEAAGKRPRRPSANVEAWPAKKPKGDRDGLIPSIEGEGEKTGQAGSAQGKGA